MSEKEVQELIKKEDVRNTVSKNFIYLRNQLGLSAEKMGKLIGLSRQNYSSIESGAGFHSVSVINMARHCGISLENIFLNDLSTQGDIQKENPND